MENFQYLAEELLSLSHVGPNILLFIMKSLLFTRALIKGPLLNKIIAADIIKIVNQMRIKKKN